MSILWLIFVFYLILLKVNCHVGASKNGVLYYTNEWAVHTFSRDLAEDIANKEGFHITQVPDLHGLYVFHHPKHPRKANNKNKEVIEKLKKYEEVTWVDQLAVLPRETRHFDLKINPKNVSCPRSESSSASTRYKRVVNDEYFEQQWYMQDCRTSVEEHYYDLNVVPAWYDLQLFGRGVVVIIIDDGLETTHPDLADNYSSKYGLDLQDGDNVPDPVHFPRVFSHGTRCGGVIAMEANNKICGVGIAPLVTLGAVRLLGPNPTNELMDAKAFLFKLNEVDIMSNSWGPPDDGVSLQYLSPLIRTALKKGAREGRKGKGLVYVFAAGNGKGDGDNCGYDAYVNSEYTIAVASADYKGKIIWYSESCASVMVTSYSGDTSTPFNVITTDTGGKQCTTEHNGTSASAPMVAGALALALEANKSLTYRDLQHLLTWTSTIAPLYQNPGWIRNSAGFYVNRNFGFGLLDVYSLVSAAKTFETVPSETRCVSPISLRNIMTKISRSEGLNLFIEVDACKNQTSEVNYLEHVQLTIRIRYSKRGDLQIRLTSPGGTKVQLLEPRKNDNSSDGFFDWTLNSVMTWGETPKGRWRIDIYDMTGPITNEGEVENLVLTFIGTKETPKHYTKEAPRIYYF